MKNNVAVFIVTHGRAEEQKTLETLSKCGWHGKTYLVIDDEDAQGDRYRELYGDMVIQFSKKAVECDTFTNNIEWGTPLYARNACYDIARELGYRHVLMCDDDITRFSIRYKSDGKLKGKMVTDMDTLLDKMADCNVAILGFSQDGSFIGGLGSSKWQRGYQRTCSQAMMVDVEKAIPWRGIFGEDLNISLDAGNMGEVVISTMWVAIGSPKRTTNAGGLHDLYAKSSMYTTLFYSVIGFPSVVKVKLTRDGAQHRIRQDGIAPMILRG